MSYSRNAQRTRERLLAAAFPVIYRHGFQAASLEEILAAAGVTKGALYHHFPSKTELGYAVVDEVLRPRMHALWLKRVARRGADPVTALQETFQANCTSVRASRVIELGCPLNNLAQEMSPLDEGFRRRVNAIFESWRSSYARALRCGQAEGLVRADIEPDKTAAFIVAAIEGAVGMAKSARSLELLRANMEVFSLFLEGLRPPASAAPSRRRRR